MKGATTNFCRDRCVEDSDCPAFTSCSYTNLCTNPAGWPCDDLLDCDDFFSSCLMVRAEADPTDGYCAPYCGKDDACPKGFTCVGDQCHKK